MDIARGTTRLMTPCCCDRGGARLQAGDAPVADAGDATPAETGPSRAETEAAAAVETLQKVRDAPLVLQYPLVALHVYSWCWWCLSL